MIVSQTFECELRSIIAYLRRHIPEPYPVIDNDELFNDIDNIPPVRLAVMLDNHLPIEFQLGDAGGRFDVFVSITATTRQQLGALASIAYTTVIQYPTIPLYTNLTLKGEIADLTTYAGFLSICREPMPQYRQQVVTAKEDRARYSGVLSFSAIHMQ